jgi:hypothetical protein
MSLSSFAQEQRGRIDSKTTSIAGDRLAVHIEAATEAAGVDISRQQIHLVLAFTTSHWSIDGLASEAEKEIGFKAASKLLVPGDEFSAVAWEMDVWESPETAKSPLQLDVKDFPLKERLKSVLPTSAQAGSLGGHDTERTIVSLGKIPGRNVVVVLFANYMASIGRKGYSLMGTNSPEYIDVLESRWSRATSVSKRGASDELPYTVLLGDGTSRERVCDVLVLTSRAFEAAELPKTRKQIKDSLRTQPSEVKTAPKVESAPSVAKDQSQGPNILPWLLGIVVLAIAGLMAYRAKGSSSSGIRAIVVNDRTVPVDASQLEQGMFLAGDQYQGAQQSLVICPELKQHLVARLELRDQSVWISPMPGYSIVLVEGETAGSSVTLRAGERKVITFGLPEEEEFVLTSQNSTVQISFEVQN